MTDRISKFYLYRTLSLRLVIFFLIFLKMKLATYVAHIERSGDFKDRDIFGGIGVNFRIILKQISF